ncbi:MAG: hypothetical protein J0L92_23075 [Deltaproteobacteria bacterium]|nr:hypothetical protein [Deltaproteobacteria bacterium]
MEVVDLLWVSLVASGGVGAVTALASSRMKSETVLGALLLVPVGFALCEFVVDAPLSLPLPELTPMAALIMAVLIAVGRCAVVLAALAVTARLAGRHHDLVVALAGAASMSMCAALVVRASTTAPRPGLVHWQSYVEGLDELLHQTQALRSLERDPSQLVALPEPPFFDRASATTMPDLPEGPTSETSWTTPDGRGVRLRSYGVEGHDDCCFARGGSLVVLLESERGALLLGQNAVGKWRPCAVEGSDMRGLVVSRAHFDRYGAPPMCAWMLALATVAGTITLALAWRERHAASRVERMKLARVEGDTALLEDGTLVRLQTPVPANVHGVLVDPQPLTLEYREDARAPVTTWIAANDGHAAVLEEMRRRVGVWLALAFVLTVWLALPAIAALRHGFVLSFG